MYLRTALTGTVMLSGFAKSTAERNTAEAIARGVKGVRLVINEIDIRPCALARERL